MRKFVSLIEENARILADIERDWGELGALRQVNFSARFYDRSDEDPNAIPVDDQVAEFLAFAQEEGCKCTVSSNGYSGERVVCVAKHIAPTAENITSIQEKLISFTRRYSGADIDGWHYPPKKTVVFWPRSSKSDSTALARAAVLFGGDLVSDPLKTKITRQESHFGRVARSRSDLGRQAPSFGGIFKRPGNYKEKDDELFKIIPSEFLEKAKQKRPSNSGRAVSSFSQWVYSLYSSELGDSEDRQEGRAAEEEIWRRRREAVSCTDNRFLSQCRSSWTLIHNGLQLGTVGQSKYFELPKLLVGGQTLRASPDLIYFNRATNEAIIVEIKFSRMDVPKNLWPNVWAQLWCYSQIEMMTRASKVTVVGEVWGEMFSHSGDRLVCLRASVRRDPRALPFDRFFRRLFEIYSGLL